MNSADELDRPINLPESKVLAMSMYLEHSSGSNDDLPVTFKGYPSECQSSVMSIIEAQIIPRLLKAERLIRSELPLVTALRAMPSKEEIQSFVNLCVSPDPLVAQIFVNRLLKEGLNTEHIFLELITPAARELGTQWELDRMDFVDVTHGLVRLHAIAHEIGFAYRDGPVVQGDIKRVMIASAPGSKHSLGPTIVADFFRKEGWQVVIEISSSKKELVQAVENEWFDTVGLSVSIASQLADLGDLVDNIKRCSRNPGIVVLLGGPIFIVENLQASDFGASGICVDAKEAVSLALALLPTDN